MDIDSIATSTGLALVGAYHQTPFDSSGIFFNRSFAFAQLGNTVGFCEGWNFEGLAGWRKELWVGFRSGYDGPFTQDNFYSDPSFVSDLMCLKS